MLQLLQFCKKKNQKKCFVILILVIAIVCLGKPTNCLVTINGLPTNDSFVEKCEQSCRDQVRKNILLILYIDGVDKIVEVQKFTTLDLDCVMIRAKNF